jgi:hypothetical protein
VARLTLLACCQWGIRYEIVRTAGHDAHRRRTLAHAHGDALANMHKSKSRVN